MAMKAKVEEVAELLAMLDVLAYNLGEPGVYHTRACEKFRTMDALEFVMACKHRRDN